MPLISPTKVDYFIVDRARGIDDNADPRQTLFAFVASLDERRTLPLREGTAAWTIPAVLSCWQTVCIQKFPQYQFPGNM